MLKNKDVVVLCLGYKNFFLDSVGPIVGSILKHKYNTKVYVYGSLNSDINAKIAKKYYSFIKNKHKNSKIIIIDALISKNKKEGKLIVTKKNGNILILANIITLQNFNKNILECIKINNVLNSSKIISKVINNM